MKKIILLVSVITLWSCSKESPMGVDETETLYENTSPQTRRSENTEPVATVNLIAGQNTIVGEVSLTLDGSTLWVTYETYENWTITETHLYLGDCENRPQNRPGNPLVGQFPYSGEHATGTQTVLYPFDVNSINQTGCIAAHAVVKNNSGGTETAWGEGNPYGGNQWAMYFQYDLSILYN